MHTIQNAIGGSKVTSSSRRIAPVYNPATGEQIAELPLSTTDEINSAVAAAKRAAVDWGTTPPLKRIKHMFRFKELLDRNADEIARAISKEHGKTHADAAGRARPRHRRGRFRLRHPASSEGRVQPQCRPRHRQLVRPPTARRRRRHHAVQLPGHGADVDVSGGDRLRQHLPAEAVRARPLDVDAGVGAVPGGGLPGRRVQCRAWRQRGRRRNPRPSRHQGR